MKKLWSFFWLVVAVCVAVTILASMIAPYIGLIFGVGGVLVLAYAGYKVWRFFRRGRGPTF